MKRFIKFLLLFIILTLLAIWSPWTKLNFNLGELFGIKNQEIISGLQISSLSGDLEVLIDNNSNAHVTKDNSPYFIDKIIPGDHLVTIKRFSDVKNAYWVLSKLITFQGGTNVVMSYDIGPEEEFSEGHIIYATEKLNKNSNNLLNIKVNVDEVQVQIDNSSPETINLNTTQYQLSINQQHTLRFAKNGYEPLEFTILPSSQEERDKLKNYDLNVEVQLILQPVEVESK